MWDSILGFFDKYGDTIAKGVGFAQNAYNAYNQNSAEQGSRSDILGALYAQSAARAQRQQDLYNWQVQQAQAGAAASAANSRAAAAASMANQKAALAAGKKALKTQKKYLEQIAQSYSPYTDAAKSLVPKSAENYGQFLDSTSLLNAYLTPKALEVMGNAPKSVTEFAPPKSSYEVGVPKGATTTFPDVMALLNRSK